MCQSGRWSLLSLREELERVEDGSSERPLLLKVRIQSLEEQDIRGVAKKIDSLDTLHLLHRQGIFDGLHHATHRLSICIGGGDQQQHQSTGVRKTILG